MTDGSEGPRGPIFPPWFDRAVKIVGAFLGAGAVFYAVLYSYAASPETLAVGYQPKQPIRFSHLQHAGQLGIDCRYCHNTVEEAAFAAVPPTQTCMNCHAFSMKDSEQVLPIRESHASGMPIPWVKVHNLPDYAYFDHSVHLAKGVGCVSCHGRIDKMDTVYQAEPLNMGWCLDCHRDPAQHLRPLDRITDMDWVPEEDQETLGKRLMQERDIHARTDCTTCHR